MTQIIDLPQELLDKIIEYRDLTTTFDVAAEALPASQVSQCFRITTKRMIENTLWTELVLPENAGPFISCYFVHATSY